MVPEARGLVEGSDSRDEQPAYWHLVTGQPPSAYVPDTQIALRVRRNGTGLLQPKACGELAKPRRVQGRGKGPREASTQTGLASGCTMAGQYCTVGAMLCAMPTMGTCAIC